MQLCSLILSFSWVIKTIKTRYKVIQRLNIAAKQNTERIAKVKFDLQLQNALLFVNSS